jgi:hypothetical protein
MQESDAREEHEMERSNSKENRERNTTPASLILCAVIAGLALLTLHVQSKTNQEDSEAKTSGRNKVIRKDLIAATELRIVSVAQRLTVLGLEKNVESGRFTVRLRNDYDKTVTALQVGIGIVQDAVDLAIGDDPSNLLPPGGVREETYPFEPELETTGFRILSVIFDDGSTDGDPASVQVLTDLRTGAKLARQKSAEVLREIAALPDARMRGELRDIDSKVRSSGAQMQATAPFHVKSGFDAQVDLVLARVRSVVQAADSKPQPESESSTLLRQGLSFISQQLESNPALLK